MEVSPTGEVKVSTIGYKGAACKDATKALEKALGSVTSDTPTPEAYERETLHTRNRS